MNLGPIPEIDRGQETNLCEDLVQWLQDELHKAPGGRGSGRFLAELPPAHKHTGHFKISCNSLTITTRILGLYELCLVSIVMHIDSMILGLYELCLVSIVMHIDSMILGLYELCLVSIVMHIDSMMAKIPIICVCG